MTTSLYDVMGGFLTRHAYQNVWCTPNQDRQAIFKPQRLSADGGAWVNFQVMWRTTSLPDKKSRFAVYQIGQLYPPMLGLENARNTWVNLATAMKDGNLMADIYTVNGVQIHRSQVWYKVTQDKDLIIAVRIPEQTKISINLDTEDLFFRFYTNAWYQSTRANTTDDVIYVEGIQAVTTTDILAMQNKIVTYRQKPGYVTCWLNGFRVENISLINSVPGDYIEFVFDASVKRTVTFKTTSLQQFTSILDNTFKYLLHYPGNVGEIEYHDDVDFYLGKPGPTAGRFKSVYVNKNDEATVRMVTHQDYSINVQHLAAYATAHPELGSFDGLNLHLVIRNSGYARPLVQEHHHIQDLYKLSDADLVSAMLGVNSTVDVWTAPNLENSQYCAIMRADLGKLTVQEVQDAYGYNAISKLVGDTPTRTVLQSTAQRITIPSGLGDSCTVYEYDASGYLIGYYPHTTGQAYQCQNTTARLCEVLSGIADTGIEQSWNITTESIDLNLNHRFYICGQSQGVIDSKWVDVTGSDWYAIVNGVLTWLVDPTTKYTLRRSNAKHLIYTLDYAAVDSLITFSIAETRPDLQNAQRTLAVPMGELDVFLNGRSLVEKIDYIVDFPRVTIINKQYLNNPDTTNQQIVVRFTNFCKSDLSREVATDVGFVQFGTLSYNNRYDIREDKVNRIVVEGQLWRYDELEFAEGDFAIHVTGATNGFPYSIRDIVVPMNDYLFNTDQKVDPTYTLRSADMVVDQAISDYLTLKIPEKVPSQPSAIAALYQLVSPFFSRIVYDLNSGALWDEAYTEQYSDDYVRVQCHRYEYLLAWDPITDTNFPDPTFTVIMPHNLNHYVDMGIYQFKFLTRVQRIYCPDRISLSGSIRVKQF